MTHLLEWLKQAQHRVDEGELAAARRLVARVLEQDDTNVEAWMMRARLSDNEWDARRAWQRVLDLAPGHKEAQRALGYAHDPKRPAERATSSALALPLPSRRSTIRHGEVLLGLGQRVWFAAVILLALMFLSFLGLEMARGTEFAPALSHALGTTTAYLGQLARGDLGTISSDTAQLLPRPVADVLGETLSKSLGLLAVSLLFATLVGVVLGLLAAWRRYSGWSLVLLLSSLVGVSVPSFFAAILLQRLVISWGRMTGGSAPIPVGGFGWDAHIILPALVLAARPLAQIARVTFVAMSDALGQDYVRTAKSKGLREGIILRRHVTRNALIPILTTIGLSLRFALSSLPVVELFFGWPGVGATLLDAIARRDDTLTVALILALGLLFILVNMLLDLSYRAIDPRLRAVAGAARARSQTSLLGALRTFVGDLVSMVVNNPLVQWVKERRRPFQEDTFRTVLATRGEPESASLARYARERRRTWLRATLRNLPFVLGTLLVLGLGIIFLFGPALAPHSPYTRNIVAMVDGSIHAPPFRPGIDYPWGSDFLGRDVMSLVLAGAQQTLLLAALVVVGRMAIGLLLGALAGWQQGSRLDRLILGLSETVAAFPTLILAMILVLALGIREGLPPFVIALTLVGWSEVMQFVRSEVFALKPQLFIESAVAIGLRAPRIVIGHVLPNLLPSLIAIAALEMGAVLMLLGELGFVGIFIGGGISTDADMATGQGIHYSDVPEWGALLSNIHGYIQAYPWMAIYPAAAFFIAILAFNLFGEGIRRLVDDVGINLTRLVNRYTLAMALVLFLSWGWVRDHTGEAAVYRRQAAQVEGERATAHVEALTAPEMQGRAIGSAGMEAAAAYIAQQFESLGLQRAGEDSTYFQTKKRSFEVLDDVPQFSIADGGAPLRYREGFVEYAGYFRNRGEVEGPVRLMMFDALDGDFGWWRTPTALRRQDYSGEVLLFLSGDTAALTSGIPYAGALVVTDDPALMDRTVTLGAVDPTLTIEWVRDASPDRPIFWISEDVAERLLARAGLTLEEARAMQAGLELDQVETLPLDTAVAMQIEGTIKEQVPAVHVIGHLPGDSHEYDENMIVVMAQYDSPPVNPAIEFPNANDNASGVAVMLEIIAAMKESNYQPYKTFLFIAYSGEGQEGGELLGVPDIDDFLAAKQGFQGNFEIDAVIHLRGVGAGTGAHPVFESGGSLRLAELFGIASRRMDTGAERIIEAVDIGVVAAEGRGIVRSQQESAVSIHWAGWEETRRTAEDTPAAIDEGRLERVGEWVAHALMIMGRDTTR